MDIPRMGVPEKLADRMSTAEQHEYLRSRFSRRRMPRTGAVSVGALGAGSASAAPQAAPSATALAGNGTRADHRTILREAARAGTAGPTTAAGAGSPARRGGRTAPGPGEPSAPGPGAVMGAVGSHVEGCGGVRREFSSRRPGGGRPRGA